MNIETARRFILDNYFDGMDNVEAVVGGDEEAMAMKLAVEALEKQIQMESYDRGDEAFVSGCKTCEDSAEILNWYRNLYYKESRTTEHGITAQAINDILPECNRLKEELEEVKINNECILVQLKNAYEQLTKLNRECITEDNDD